MHSSMGRDWRRRARWLGAALVWALPAAGVAQSEAPAIATDRPGQADTTSIALRGTWQIEAGVSYGEDTEGSTRLESLAAPVGVLRIGLARRAELRLGWGGYQSLHLEDASGTSDSDGFADASLGAKLLLAEERGRRPRMAVLLATSLPVGESGVGSGRFDPGLRLAFDHTLSDRTSLNYNLGASVQTSEEESGDRDRLATWFYATSLWHSLSDRWGSYVEIFGTSPAAGEETLALGGGLTLLTAANLQLDASLEIGLAAAAPDWTLGLGVSYRAAR